MENIFMKSYKNPIIHNPEDHIIYQDNPARKLDDNYVYENPIMNARGFSLAASSKDTDPLRITEVFYGEHADTANDFYSKLNKAKETGDRSLAAAVITSKEYTLLQDSAVLGQNEELIRTGILTQIFEEIAAPNLAGKWNTFANDVRYLTNLPESKSPEPTFGGVSQTTIEVPKHGGSIAITDRARQVINGADVFGRLVSQLLQKRSLSESIIVRTAIEGIAATNDQTGVDFGIRSGTPPASTQNPIDLINTLINFFDATRGSWDTIVSKSFIFNEYSLNDIVRGGSVLNPLPQVGTVQEQSGPVPALQGVTWFRDNLMSSSTNMYVMDRTQAGKSFRGPTRAYTVTDPDTETEKYVTKSFFTTYIVDGTLIARVTGVAA